MGKLFIWYFTVASAATWLGYVLAIHTDLSNWDAALTAGAAFNVITWSVLYLRD